MIDPLKQLPGYALRRASSAVMAELADLLAPHDLRVSESTALLLMDANPQITQSEVGRTLDIKRPNMVPLTLRLEARGLIQREPVNGRSQSLSLTAYGKDVAAKVRDIVESYEEALIARVPIASRDHILPILSALWLGPRKSS